MTTRRPASLLAIMCLGLLATGSLGARIQNPAAPSSSLRGAWQQQGQSAMLIATNTYAAFFGVESLPSLSTYTMEGSRIRLQPAAAERSFEDQILEDDLGIKSAKSNPELALDRVELGADTLRFVTPGGVTLTWRRLE